MENDAGKQFADSAALATEAVTSIKTISSLTLERQIMDEFTAAMDGVVSQSIRGLSVALIPYALSQSAEFLVLALGFWYGSRLIASGEYSTQQFFVVFIAVVSAISRILNTHRDSQVLPRCSVVKQLASSSATRLPLRKRRLLPTTFYGCAQSNRRSVKQMTIMAKGLRAKALSRWKMLSLGACLISRRKIMSLTAS